MSKTSGSFEAGMYEHSIYFITYYYAYVTKVCNLLHAIFIDEILSNESIGDMNSSNSISNFG